MGVDFEDWFDEFSHDCASNDWTTERQKKIELRRALPALFTTSMSVEVWDRSTFTELVNLCFKRMVGSKMSLTETQHKDWHIKLRQQEG